MAIGEKYRNQLFRLFDLLRINVGFYDLYSNATHLLFLKYLITYSDKLPDLSVESFKALITFKRKYDNAKTGSEPLSSFDFRELFSKLDQDFVFSDMRLGDSFWTYDDIFRNKTSQKAILQALEDVEFESNQDFVGDFLELLAQESMRDAKMTGESVTGKSLRELSAGLLSVTSDDVFLNCFSGYSSITLNIKDFKHYYGYELNSKTFIVSKMLLVMRGMSNATVINDNFLTSDTKELANKAFSDGPLSMKYEDFPTLDYFGAKTKDGDLLILYKVLDSLKQNGTAVIAVPGRTLFSESTSYRQMREIFTNNGLKAIISLPPLWVSTLVPTNLIVVQRGYEGKIVFINASTFGLKSKNKGNVVLSDDEIDKIVSTVSDFKEVDNFSAIVAREEVLSKNDWVPNKYIKNVPKGQTNNLEDINSELFDIYQEIKNSL